MEHRTREVRCISGMGGSGKTFLAAKLYARESESLVYNYAHDQQFNTRSTYVPIIGGVEQARSIGRLIRIMRRRNENWRISFEPTDIVDDRPESFEEVCFQCYEAERMTLYVDEMHQLGNANFSPRWMRTLILVGRHREVSVTYITHKIKLVDVRLRYNTRVFDFFWTDDELELKAIVEVAGDEVADKVTELRTLRIDEKTRKITQTPQYYEWNRELRIGKLGEL